MAERENFTAGLAPRADTDRVTLEHELAEYARSQTGSLPATHHRDRAHKNADHALVEHRMAHVPN
ncbi:hypothetical protein FAF44_35035 [Nonomuraea sp. MG754425]|nr:hypothetical protein [Nonomuraea sp. MG754425]